MKARTEIDASREVRYPDSLVVLMTVVTRFRGDDRHRDVLVKQYNTIKAG